jgi:hypothetical protein
MPAVYQCGSHGHRKKRCGAAAFIGDAQPTHLRAVLQSDLVSRVHLPDFVHADDHTITARASLWRIRLRRGLQRLARRHK